MGAAREQKFLRNGERSRRWEEGGTTIEVASKVGEGRGPTLKRRGRGGSEGWKEREEGRSNKYARRPDQKRPGAWPPVSLLV